MPPNTHGDFDLVIELDQDLITRMARLQLGIKTQKEPVGQDPKSDDFTGEAMISPSLAYIWFNEEGGKPGTLHRSRSTTDVVSIVLGLGKGLIRIKTFLNRITSPPTMTTIQEPAGDIPIEGYIDITDRVESITADAVLDRASPNEKTPSLCAVIDFSQDGSYPEIQVRLREGPILQAPLIMLYLANAYLSGFQMRDGRLIPPGDAAREAAKGQLLDNIRGQIGDAVLRTLASTTSWKLNRPGVVPLHIQPISPSDPLGATALTILTISTSLLLLFQTIGSGGNPALIARSRLGRRTSMVITIPHNTLIGGVVRKAVIDSFTGLSQGSFWQGQPCILAGRTRVTTRPKPGEDPQTFTLTSLIANVDESSQIRIAGSIEDSPLLGAITWTASFDIAIRLDAGVSILDGIPKLVITPTVVSSSVTKSDIAIAWWVYVITAGIAAFISTVPLIIAAIVDFFGGGLVEGRVKDGLSNMVMDPSSQGLPGGTRLSVTDTSMHDDDAPRRFINIVWLSIFVGRDHDLSIGLGSEDLPGRLKVTCIVPDSTDADRRIDAVGGTLPDGTPWGMSIDEAIAAIESGNLKMFVGDPPNEAEVEVVTPSGRLPYLRTKPGPGPNLLDLPGCPRV